MVLARVKPMLSIYPPTHMKMAENKKTARSKRNAAKAKNKAAKVVTTKTTTVNTAVKKKVVNTEEALKGLNSKLAAKTTVRKDRKVGGGAVDLRELQSSWKDKAKADKVKAEEAKLTAAIKVAKDILDKPTDVRKVTQEALKAAIESRNLVGINAAINDAKADGRRQRVFRTHLGIVKPIAEYCEGLGWPSWIRWYSSQEALHPVTDAALLAEQGAQAIKLSGMLHEPEYQHLDSFWVEDEWMDAVKMALHHVSADLQHRERQREEADALKAFRLKVKTLEVADDLIDRKDAFLKASQPSEEEINFWDEKMKEAEEAAKKAEIEAKKAKIEAKKVLKKASTTATVKRNSAQTKADTLAFFGLK